MMMLHIAVKAGEPFFALPILPFLSYLYLQSLEISYIPM